MKKFRKAIPMMIGSLCIVIGLGEKLLRSYTRNSIRIKQHNRASSIIGGADGPTSIFVAGKVNSQYSTTCLLVGTLILSLTVFVHCCLKRKNQ